MKALKIKASVEDFAKASAFIEKELEANNVSKEIISENMLVFEALFNSVIEQGFGEETTLEISNKNRLGDLSIKLGFEGKMFLPMKNFTDEITPEDKIMKAYDDKLSYTYHSSYNVVTLMVKRGQRKPIIFCAIGFLVAIALYAILHACLTPNVQEVVLSNYVFPIEKVFADAMLMIGAPVTFFSLMKNIMDTYIIAERSSVARKLQPRTIITSIIAIILSSVTFIVFFVFIKVSSAGQSILEPYSAVFSDILEQLVPSNIFEPFMVISPFPIILIAILAAYAFCSVGKFFSGIKRAIDACYTFFSKMLSIVMYALPFFCFIAFLDVLLANGFKSLLSIVEFIAVSIVAIFLLLLFYYIRLKVGKVNVKSFVKKLGPLLKENLRINSAIDATAYNTRYCVKNYKMNRKRLEESLPMLAQTNLDGNCLIIMGITCGLIFLNGSSISVVEFLLLAFTVLFLSLGAPNQPGSILIGTLIIISYLTPTGTMVGIAIYMEVIYGSVQNIINVLGDIVTVAIEETKAGVTI